MLWDSGGGGGGGRVVWRGKELMADLAGNSGWLALGGVDWREIDNLCWN